MSGAFVFSRTLLCFCPTILCIVGVVLLIVALIVSPEGSAVQAEERQLWQPVNGCLVIDSMSGVVYSKEDKRRKCVEDFQADGCHPLCVALLRCESNSTTTTADNSTTTIASNQTQTQTNSSANLLLAFSLRALYTESVPSQPWCSKQQTDWAGWSVLRNPKAPRNVNVTLANSYSCFSGDIARCCPDCAVFETVAELRQLQSALRWATFLVFVGPAIAVMLIGATWIVAMILIFTCDKNENRPVVPVPAPLDDDAIARAHAHLQRDAIGGVGAEGAAVRRAPRRRRHRKRPSAPPLVDDDDDANNDEFDTSPSPAAAAAAVVVIRCKTCQQPFLANSDALACSSCHKISEERLERAAFPFGGGDSQMCTVCLDDIEAGVRVVTLPCAHLYHFECIAEWLTNKTICPQCLTEIV